MSKQDTYLEVVSVTLTQDITAKTNDIQGPGEYPDIWKKL